MRNEVMCNDDFMSKFYLPEVICRVDPRNNPKFDKSRGPRHGHLNLRRAQANK